jgi:HEAT repeat protein
MIVAHRADVLPREDWAALSRRCRDDILRGTPDQRVAELRFTDHLQRVARSERSLRDAYAEDLCDAIAGALMSDDEKVRHAAIPAAGWVRQLGGDALVVVPGLLRNLTDSDPKVRIWAINALPVYNDAGEIVGLGEHGPAALQAFLRGLDDPDRRVRGACSAGLGNLGEAGRAAVPELIRRLKAQGVGGSETRVIAFALQGLGPFAVEGVPTLIELPRAGDENDRVVAARTLGRIGPDAREAVPDMIDALDDSSEPVSWAAARALGEIGPSAAAALPKLQMKANADPEALSGLAAWAIERITGKPK